MAAGLRAAQAQTAQLKTGELEAQDEVLPDILSAREFVRDQLLADILRGRIDPLPTEEDPLNESTVMKLYGQRSRMPVRMALAVLAGEGLFRQRARYGYWLVDYDIEDMEQILMMRARIEAMVAAALCEREIASGGTEGAPFAPLRLEAWREALKVHEKMAKIARPAGEAQVSPPVEATFADLDTRLHVLLARAGGYDMAARHIVEWRNQMRIFARQNKLTCDAHAFPTIHEEHTQIIDAIKSADRPSAAALARAHVENVLARNWALIEDPAGPG
jgi:DNA-binding GntR family transcriptional regulator